MDAKITKERLGNFLSYDWIKIVCAIVAAIMFLLVLFTTIGAGTTSAQRFSVYGYLDLSYGDDAVDFANQVKSAHVFSYDILEVESENFTDGTYSSAQLVTRRSTGDGDCMFVSNYKEKEDSLSTLEQLVVGYGADFMLDPALFLADCEAYLNGFYSDWTAGTLDEARVKEAFLARNGKDKRFRSEESKAQGIVQEKERLERLRRDYEYVISSFESGLLTYTTVTVEGEGETVTAQCAIGLGKLNKMTELYYYTVEKDGETVRTAEDLTLILFDNKDWDGDLKYDTISFLRYVAQHYGS